MLTSKNKKQFFVIAHNIRSLENVGSIFRSADAFAVSKLYLTGYTGSPPESKISKTALGAENSVPWEKHKSAVRLIKKIRIENPGVVICGLENNLPNKEIVSLASFKPKFPLALVLGTETTGIPKNVLKECDILLEIPMQGKKESLNVAVAFGIAAFKLVNMDF